MPRANIQTDMPYLMSCGYFLEIGQVANWAYREAAVDQTVVDKHVGHAKHSDAEPLQSHSTIQQVTRRRLPGVDTSSRGT
jgi:hypothetical protein